MKKLILLSLSIITISSLNAGWTSEKSIGITQFESAHISPDGKQIVYTVRIDDLEHNETRLHITCALCSESESAFPLTSSLYKSWGAKWSPNGDWIAFLSDRTGSTQLFLIRVNGGEAIQITDVPGSVEIFEWAPDGNTIALVIRNTRKEENIRIVTPEKFDQRLYIIEAKPTIQTPEPLTDESIMVIGNFGVPGMLAWAPDSNEIAFCYCIGKNIDDFFRQSKIGRITLSGKRQHAFPECAPYQSVPGYSPDGNWIAFLKSDEESYYDLTRYIMMYERQTGQVKQLTTLPNEGQFLNGSSLVGWAADSSAVYMLEPSRTQFALWRVPIDGSPAVRVDDQTMLITTISLHSQSMFSCVAQNLNTPPEVYISSLDTYDLVCCSNENKDLLNESVPITEKITWHSVDGTEIEGLLTYPIGYEEEKAYPLIVHIHGGPMSFFYEQYLGLPFSRYPGAIFAQEGYLLLRPNIRGSTGYGNEFRKGLTNHWGKKAFEDVMAGIDYVIEQGVADPQRLGIMGWSYGGYFTAWAITQTDRFKAAAMGAGVYDLISVTNTSDMFTIVSSYMGDAQPCEALQRYLDCSPIAYVHQVPHIPLLIQHGTQDVRVPISQAYELYYALKAYDHNPLFIEYLYAGHHFSCPQELLDHCQRNINFFNKNL